MKIRNVLAMLLALAMMLSLVACGTSAPAATTAPAAATEAAAEEAPADTAASAPLAGQTIIIGNIAPMTGALAAYGTAVDNSIRMAAAEINAAGGILGATVEISTKDDQHTPAEAVSGFNALLSEGVTAIIGAVASADTLPIPALPMTRA